MMLFLVFLLINFLNSITASAYYCDNGYCNGPDVYCCGNNECCTNVMTMWYFWFALLIGVVITCLLVCKYNSRVSNELLPVVWPPPQQPQQFSKVPNAPHEHYLYKPLRNTDDDYLDQKFTYNSNIAIASKSAIPGSNVVTGSNNS